MLSEPISVASDFGGLSLRRVASGNADGRPSLFRSSDGEFLLSIAETSKKESVRYELLLTRTVVDDDSDPFNGPFSNPSNSVGMVFEVNRLKYRSDTDIPSLQSALLTLVGSIYDRVVSGEK